MSYKKIQSIFFSILNYVFHPIFIPFYFFLIFVHLLPLNFKELSPLALQLRIFSVFFNTIFFPLFAVFLLYKLKFIKTIYLKNQTERIIPIVINMFFYWWMFYLYRNFMEHNVFLKSFFLGIFFSTIIALIANNFYKISLHALGLGSFFMAIILMSIHFSLFIPYYWIFTVGICFLICNYRMKTKQHSKYDIVTGFFYAMFCQFIAFLITM